MSNQSADRNTPDSWLAETVRALLNKKYGEWRVPGVRRISADIGLANNGETISHGHVHNILSGVADNLTDRTRVLLARFFDKPLSYFYPPDIAGDSAEDSVQALAVRFATLNPEQMDAIKEAIAIVTRHSDQREE